jgi:hypothetical protein
VLNGRTFLKRVKVRNIWEDIPDETWLLDSLGNQPASTVLFNSVILTYVRARSSDIPKLMLVLYPNETSFAP